MSTIMKCFACGLVLLTCQDLPAAFAQLRRRNSNRLRFSHDLQAPRVQTIILEDEPELLLTVRSEEKALDEQPDSVVEMIREIDVYQTTFMSLPPNTNSPTDFPTGSPTTSTVPTSIAPVSPIPTISIEPSKPPMGTSNSPSRTPIVSESPTGKPTPLPTEVPTPLPTEVPTPVPTPVPSKYPSTFPSVLPSLSTSPTFPPSTEPSLSSAPSVASPSSLPSSEPSLSLKPSASPTLFECGITEEQRRTDILSALDLLADSQLIRDETTPQGKATAWIISEDVRLLCPDDTKFVQRWVMAVMYFSTGGPNWLQCSREDMGCGATTPFVNQLSFLSPANECEWAGLSCNFDACVTEIEFEENNLVGTIPTELGLLDDLIIWGMERGNLTGTIPSEMGQLQNLIFIDLDFNSLTGSIPSELYELANLSQLDLNNNLLEGPIDGIGNFTELEFLQLHANLFTGTIPETVGSLTGLSTFTLHESFFTGTVPSDLCLLVDSGTLTSLIADCSGATPEIACDCCTDCRP